MAQDRRSASLTGPDWRNLSPSRWEAARVAAVATLQDVRLLRADMVARHFDWNARLAAASDITLELAPPDDDDRTLVVEATLVVRITDADDTDLEADDLPVTTVTCTYGALFNVPSDFEGQAPEYQAFSDTVGLTTLYPYAREFVQSATARMGLPPLTIPMIKQTVQGPNEGPPSSD